MRCVPYSNEDLIRQIARRVLGRLKRNPLPAKDELELIIEAAIIEVAAKYAPK